MAIHRDYKGREEEDPGRWHPYKIDPDTKVLAEMRVRRMSRDVSKKFNRDWQEPIEVVLGKNKVEKRLEIPKEKAEEFWSAVVCWMWLDVRNFFVAAYSAEAVDFYRRELNDNSIELETEFSLDGRINDAIKKYLLVELVDITDVISGAMARGTVEVTVDEGRRQQEREEALSANLRTGSPSKSVMPTSPRMESDVEVAPSLVEAKASHA